MSASSSVNSSSSDEPIREAPLFAHGSNNISRLQLLIKKKDSGKLYILNLAITILKYQNYFTNKNFLAIVLIDKATSSISSSLLHLHKNRLDLSIRKGHKDLDRETLKIY